MVLFWGFKLNNVTNFWIYYLELIRISLISYIDYWNNSRAMHNLRRGSLM